MNVTSDPTIAIYLSLAVALAVWIGIYIYLWTIEHKVQELQRKLEKLTEQRNSLVSSTSSGTGLPEHTPAPIATLERRTQEE